MTKNTIRKNEDMVIDAVYVAAENGNEVVPNALATSPVKTKRAKPKSAAKKTAAEKTSRV